MTATGNYSDGSTKDLTGKVLWSSSSTSCATISGAGLVKPVSNVTGVCSTTIKASFGTVSPATTTVTVSGGTPTQITLTASTTTPARNTTLTFKALATFSGSGTQDITSSVTWNNSDTNDLTLTNGSGTGTISANAVSGTGINVSASFAGVTSNTVTLTVQ
jgi:trimeric autotransporter adhesin